ncbi:hypothetical protein K2173_007343 [Erythroxylum novogranatense]|uniref:Uncharacterized protein n=1 Tax=Erythroxylum novogranatense TaxID=1862640 RepID=A0AAV8T7N3_9ROSI|nr:hypothetical protein K2173_007343 [Erythroxylum novogranatense]
MFPILFQRQELFRFSQQKMPIGYKLKPFGTIKKFMQLLLMAKQIQKERNLIRNLWFKASIKPRPISKMTRSGSKVKLLNY